MNGHCEDRFQLGDIGPTVKQFLATLLSQRHPALGFPKLYRTGADPQLVSRALDIDHFVHRKALLGVPRSEIHAPQVLSWSSGHRHTHLSSLVLQVTAV